MCRRRHSGQKVGKGTYGTVYSSTVTQPESKIASCYLLKWVLHRCIVHPTVVIAICFEENWRRKWSKWLSEIKPKPSILRLRWLLKPSKKKSVIEEVFAFSDAILSFLHLILLLIDCYLTMFCSVISCSLFCIIHEYLSTQYQLWSIHTC